MLPHSHTLSISHSWTRPGPVGLCVSHLYSKHTLTSQHSLSPGPGGEAPQSASLACVAQHLLAPVSLMC